MEVLMILFTAIVTASVVWYLIGYSQGKRAGIEIAHEIMDRRS